MKSNNESQIATKFNIGMTVAISAASLCINRRLYHIACIRVVTATKSDRRRAVLVDLAIGVGIPVLVMILRMFPYPFFAYTSDQHPSQTTSFKASIQHLRRSWLFSRHLLHLAHVSHHLPAAYHHRSLFRHIRNLDYHCLL